MSVFLLRLLFLFFFFLLLPLSRVHDDPHPLSPYPYHRRGRRRGGRRKRGRKGWRRLPRSGQGRQSALSSSSSSNNCDDENGASSSLHLLHTQVPPTCGGEKAGQAAAPAGAAAAVPAAAPAPAPASAREGEGRESRWPHASEARTKSGGRRRGPGGWREG